MNILSPATQNPDVNGLIAAIARNKEDETLAKFLGPQHWYALAPYLHPSDLERGQVLISQGAKDRKLYFLESGSLKIDVTIDAGFIQLAIVGPGTVVGEGGFFSHLTRTASVVAYSDCKVWAFSPSDFELLSKQNPSVALALSMALGAVLATRMLDLSKRIAVT